MNARDFAGSGLLIVLALIGIVIMHLNRHGISGCLRRRKERQLRRAARAGAMAKCWDWFWPLALDKWREFHREELSEVFSGRAAEIASDSAGMLEEVREVGR